jgi:hypothetical protein
MLGFVINLTPVAVFGRDHETQTELNDRLKTDTVCSSQSVSPEEIDAAFQTTCGCNRPKSWKYVSYFSNQAFHSALAQYANAS